MPPTVSAFTWIDVDTAIGVSGLGIDNQGDSYLIGSVTSPSLTPLNSALGGAANCVLQCSLANLNELGGWVAEINAAGTPIHFTYLDGSGRYDGSNGGTFAAGALYVVGVTDAPATNVPAGSVALAGVATVQPAAGPQALPTGQDLTSSGRARGYLVSLNPSLSAVNYVANIGGLSGGDIPVAVSTDASGNAYVATSMGNGSIPYTPLGAFEAVTPATSGSSAYLAEVAASNTLYGLKITAATGSPAPDPIAYAAGPPLEASSVTYTWTLNATSSAPAANVVLQIASPAALTFSSAKVSDVSPGATAAPVTCTVAAAGGSCVIPNMQQTVPGVNDTWSLAVNATTNSSLPPAPSQISVTATAWSPASETSTVTQTSNVVGVPTLTLTNTVSPAIETRRSAPTTPPPPTPRSPIPTPSPIPPRTIRPGPPFPQASAPPPKPSARSAFTPPPVATPPPRPATSPPTAASSTR